MSRLLVVADDSPEMRWVVRTALGDEFDEVIEAKDGRELLGQLVACAHSRPAAEVLVITDLRMPGYTGLEVLAAYEELSYYPATVVMTAYPSADIHTGTARVGAVLLPKPFAARDLRRVVGIARQV